VHDRGRPLAIAPLMLERVRTYGLPVQRLRGIAHVYTERFDFILSVRPTRPISGMCWNCRTFRPEALRSTCFLR
jgi:hypothetical protein